MTMRPQGRPPFRADHIGSLLRPPALREAFKRRAARQIGEDEFTRSGSKSSLTGSSGAARIGAGLHNARLVSKFGQRC